MLRVLPIWTSEMSSPIPHVRSRRSGQRRMPALAPADRRLLAFCLVAYLLMGTALYSRTLGSFFLSDDFDLINGLHGSGGWRFWISGGGGWMRPGAAFSVWLDGAVSGKCPVAYHVTNVLLHSFNAFAVTLLALAIGRVGDDVGWLRRGGSCLAGLLFLVLATHTEPVSWISCRGDLLAAFFSLLSVLGYVLYLQRRRLGFLGASLVSFAVALMAKESALAVLPIVVIFGLFLVPDQSSKLRRIAPHAAVTLGYVILRSLLVSGVVGGYGAGVHLRLNAEVVGKLFVYFPSRVLIPGLGTIDVGGLVVPANVIVFGAGVVAIIAASARGRQRRLTRTVFVMAAASLAALLPVFNLSVSTWNSEGTRFLYLPSAFFVITLVVALGRVLHGRTLAVVGTALVVLSAGGTYYLNENWRTAGQLAHEIVEDVCRAPEGRRVVVINVPDSVRGAYVFRNGIGSAAALFCEGRGPGDVVAICCHPVTDPDEPFPTSEEPEGSYLIDVPEGRLVNVSSPFRRSGTDCELAQFECLPEGIRFRPLPPENGKGPVYYRYSSGYLHAVDPPGRTRKS